MLSASITQAQTLSPALSGLSHKKRKQLHSGCSFFFSLHVPVPALCFSAVICLDSEVVCFEANWKEMLDEQWSICCADV